MPLIGRDQEIQMGKEKVQIKCSFSVHYTLEMEIEDGEDFMDKICGLGIFTQVDDLGNAVLGPEYAGRDTFGLDTYVLQEQGITVVETDCDGDPSPTGRGIYRREWEIETVEEDDG